MSLLIRNRGLEWPGYYAPDFAKAELADDPDDNSGGSLNPMGLPLNALIFALWGVKVWRIAGSFLSGAFSVDIDVSDFLTPARQESLLFGFADNVTAYAVVGDQTYDVQLFSGMGESGFPSVRFDRYGGKYYPGRFHLTVTGLSGEDFVSAATGADNTNPACGTVTMLGQTCTLRGSNTGSATIIPLTAW